ncbi:MAG: PIN domain-containing protein [Acidimicrobiales bacterium]
MPLLLDAFAVVAILRGEPAADDLLPHLASGDAACHPVNLAEVLDQLVRLDGRDGDDVEADIALLGVEIAPADDGELANAGRLRARHYRRGDSAVSLADCVAAAHALAHGLTLATSDPPLAALMRTEGGTVLALPDSAGRRP